MAKRPHRAQTTHRFKATLCLNVLHIHSVGIVTRIWDLNYVYSTFEEMERLFFLNRQCIHPLCFIVRLWHSLSILPFESVKVGDHFDIHLG